MHAMILLIAPHNCTFSDHHSINPPVTVLREHAVLYLLFIDFPKACLSAREGFVTKSIVKPSETHWKKVCVIMRIRSSLNVCKLKKG